MNGRTRNLLCLAIVFASAFAAHSQTATRAQRELLKLNRAYDEALVRGDAAALDRIYAEEFVYTTFDGSVRGKAEQLKFTRSGDLRLESGTSDGVRIRIYGTTAVMTGRFTARGTFKDKPISIRERYTAVWVKKEGKWKLVAEQGNEIK